MAMLAERRQKAKFVLTPKSKPIWTSESNGIQFGKKLMEKMGWNAGQGLGATGQGIQEPLRQAFKQDTKGMGYSGDGNPFENLDQFNELLASLTGEEPAPNENHTFQSLEEKSKHSKSRVHYKKFTRGKDLANYSSMDLTCIVGSGKRVQEEVVVEDIEDHTGDTENSHGVTTINGGSIADYFKWKMGQKMGGTGFEKKSVDLENNDDSFIQGPKEGNGEVCLEIHPEVVKPKRSKRKHEDENDLGCEENNFENRLKIKKKKKKKDKDKKEELDYLDQFNPEEGSLSVNDDKGLENEDYVKKKKKRKKDKKVVSENEEEILKSLPKSRKNAKNEDDLEEVLEDGTDEIKKKKKTKHNSVEESMAEDEKLNKNDAEECLTDKKSKKKKHQKKDDDVLETEIEEVPEVKKKKKKNKYEDAEDAVLQNKITTKERKTSFEIEETTLSEDNENTSAVKALKKKKKKAKKDKETDENVIPTELVAHESPRKKKKDKKRDKSEDETEIKQSIEIITEVMTIKNDKEVTEEVVTDFVGSNLDSILGYGNTRKSKKNKSQ